MRNCTTCKCFNCQHYYEVTRTCDARGVPYDLHNGTWLYDYKACAYNFDTKRMEVFEGTVTVKPETKFVRAIAAHLRRDGKNIWLCEAASRR